MFSIKSITTYIMSLILIAYSTITCPQVTSNNSMATEYTSSDIASDIDALKETGQNLTNAAQRLIENGSIAIKQIHKTLSKEETPKKQKWVLVIILGKIADPRSVQTIIDVAKVYPDDAMLIRTIVNSLSNFERNKEIDRFIEQVFNQYKDERLISAALDCLAKHPNNKDTKWAQQYSDPKYGLRVNSTALYLGARLGISDYKEKIQTILKDRKKKTGEGKMLIALAILTTPEEFEKVIKMDKVYISHDNIKLARLYRGLHYGSKDVKAQSSREILHNGIGYLKQDAINYLIGIRDAEALAKPWLKHDKSVRYMLKKEGLAIAVDEKGARFIDASDAVEYAKTKNESQSSASATNDLLESIFLSLRTHNQSMFKAQAMISKKEYARYLRSQIVVHKSGGAMIKEYSRQFEISQPLILKSWKNVYQEGLKNKIDWPVARYVTSNIKGDKRSGNIRFLVTHKGYYYVIEIPNIMMIENKAKVFSQLRWLGQPKQSRELKYWGELAASNNDSPAAAELTVLSNNTKTGRIEILKMRASYNDAESQYKLYQQLQVSQDKSDKDKAINWLRQSADNQYAKAQYALHEVLVKQWYATHKPTILEEANRYLLQSAKQNNVYALKKIAEYYSTGSADFDLDYNKAIHYYQTLFSLDINNLDKEEAKAYQFFRVDIEDKIKKLEDSNDKLKNNDPEFITKIALQQLGNSTDSSKKRGLIMLRNASEQGHAEAHYQLGNLYAHGSEINKKDPRKAIKYWQMASDMNHVESTKNLASGYIQGRYGIHENPEEGLVLADKLVQHYMKNPPVSAYEEDSLLIWRVQACDVETKLARMKDPSYVIPRIREGRCKGL